MTALKNTLVKIAPILTSMLALVGCTPLGYVNAFVQRDKFDLSRDLAYGSLERHKLDVYTPNRANKAPVIFYVHGGSWRNGDKSDYPFLADAFIEKGFLFVAINYRLAPAVQFPAFVEDAALAFKWVKSNIAQYGGDANRIFLMGHSAGGHIASLLALDPAYLRAVGLERNAMRAFIGLAGPYDFLDFLEGDKPTQEVMGPREQWPRTQPVNFVDGLQPPMLLMQGLADKTVDPRHPLWLEERVKPKGGKLEIKHYEGVDHAGIIGAMARASRFIEPKILPDLLGYLERY